MASVSRASISFITFVWRAPARSRHPHQGVQEDQADGSAERRDQRGPPGDGEGETDVDDRRHQLRAHLRQVEIGLGGAVRLGRDGVRDGADRQARVIAPARGEQRPQQLEAQVGGGERDRVADPLVGERAAGPP